MKPRVEGGSPQTENKALENINFQQNLRKFCFLGLQEMLVYYDPGLAGVGFPTMIIGGLMAIPYIDFNKIGNGYFVFKQRAFSVITFLFGCTRACSSVRFPASTISTTQLWSRVY